VEIAWDEVDGVGQFLELELTADESDLDAARACIAALAERLSPGVAERRGYLEMLLDHVGGRNSGIGWK
jgi:adenylate cyclase class 2